MRLTTMAERRRPTQTHRLEPFVAWVELDQARVESPHRYPFSLKCVAALAERLPLDPFVTFFVGENGSGKSTLLEGIAVALGYNAEGGTKNFNFSTRSSESSLGKSLRVARSHRKPRTGYFLRAESVFNIATNIEELDRQGGGGPPIIDSYGGHSLHEQSHGESFMAIVRHRFALSGLYLLDEPESALSPARQLELLQEIRRHCRGGSQFIIATHSPFLLAYPGALTYQISKSGIARTSYEDTEHYRLTRWFFESPRERLEELFADIDAVKPGSPRVDVAETLELAKGLADSGEHRRAIQLCSRAILQHPRSAELFHQRALSKHALADTVPAMQDLATAMQLSPEQGDYYLLRGLWRIEVSAYSKALEDFGAAHARGRKTDAKEAAPWLPIAELAAAVALLFSDRAERAEKAALSVPPSTELRLNGELWTPERVQAEAKQRLNADE